MATFAHVRGNILDSTAAALVNPVNCQGAMGAGLAKQFKDRYPDLDAQYRQDCRNGLVKSGQVRLYRVSPCRTVVNLPTKDRWRDPSRMEYIEQGLQSLAAALRQEGILSVAIPALGAGLGRLSWQPVQTAIHTILADEPISVYVYPPTNRRAAWGAAALSQANMAAAPQERHRL